jgi:hypothetical protein
MAFYSYGTSSPRGLGGARLATSPTSDYAAGDTWSVGGSQGVFGACLRNATLGAATDGTTWVSKGGAACTASDSDPWHGIPATPGSAGALVARTTTANTMGARVDLQFGLRVANAQRPGDYVAPILFDVIAP